MKFRLFFLLLIFFLSVQVLFSQNPVSDIRSENIASSDLMAKVEGNISNDSLTTNSNAAQLETPIAKGLSKFLGCAYVSGSNVGFENYWNQVVPENAGKWGSVEKARDVMSWDNLDAAYNFAKGNNFPYRHHVLVWGNQQPAWIETLSSSEQFEEIDEWFQAVANRYPAIDFLEVVNEPLHDPPNQAGSGGGNYINALGGTGITGYDWILKAFRMARSYFPASTKLMLNEYGLENSEDNVKKYLKIIELLKKENLIDAVGAQGHAFSLTGSELTIKSNLDLLATAELPIYITEMDIDGPTDSKQLDEYKRIFPVFWEHPDVKGITFWGYKPGMWRTEQKAYLVTANGTERPALTWLKEYLQPQVSVEEIESQPNFVIYPNPVTSGEVTIGGAEKISEVRFFQSDGKMVRSSFFCKQQSIKLEMDFAPGIYLIQLIGKHKTTVRKIVVR
jgi:endo-1,4-beta-xylanase